MKALVAQHACICIRMVLDSIAEAARPSAILHQQQFRLHYRHLSVGTDELTAAWAVQTQELEESQTMAEELGGVMGPGRGKVIATKGSAQKGWQ